MAGATRTNLFMDQTGDAFRISRCKLIDLYSELVPIDPPDRRSCNFKRSALASDKNADRDLGPRLQGVISEDPHAGA